MVGQVLKHYRILEQIGAGGMGVVYRAHDEELDRDVAIKVLPPGTLADDSAGRRFRKEAMSLARLNHPNVAGIHGVEEINGRHFLIMELVPGETLADRIARGALPLDEALTIAKQITAALEEAHEKGRPSRST